MQIEIILDFMQYLTLSEVTNKCQLVTFIKHFHPVLFSYFLPYYQIPNSLKYFHIF